jgi:hypothetical protein
LLNFCERIKIVIRNTIHQLASLYSDENNKNERKQLQSFSNVHFNSVFQSLAETLGVLITFDEIITQNGNFKNHITLYNRMISKVKEEPENFGTDSKNIGKVQMMLNLIDADILEGTIFSVNK